MNDERKRVRVAAPPKMQTTKSTELKISINPPGGLSNRPAHSENNL